MASEEDNQNSDLVPVDLPAPSGWSKKFFPKLSGTPSRKDIVFTSPTGEEIKNKSQLEKYLKSHPGGPAVSEFDWGTGYSPRRSSRFSDSPRGLSRLSEESKGDDVTVSSLSPKKRQKKSSRMGVQEKSNADAEEGTTGEKDAAAEEGKETVEGSSDSPRRHSRLSEESKGDDLTVSSPSPKKRQKKSSRMGAREKSNAAAEEETTGEKDAAAEEAKETVEGSSADAKDGVDEDVSPGKPMTEDGENNTDTLVASEEPSATVPVGTKTEELKEEVFDDTYSPIRKVDESEEASPAVPVGTKTEELNASVGEPVDATDSTLDSLLQEAFDDMYSPIRKVDESKEASPVVPDTMNDEASNDGKETPDGKFENAVTESDDVEHSKKKEAEGKDTAPSTGS